MGSADGNRKMFTGSGGDVPESPAVPATIGVRYRIVSLHYPPVERALETLGRCAEDVVLRRDGWRGVVHPSACADRTHRAAQQAKLRQQEREVTRRLGGDRPPGPTAQTDAVTLIQRFGSSLDLNVHFHMLFLDEVFVERSDGSLGFLWVKEATSAELVRLTQTLALRIGRTLAVYSNGRVSAPPRLSAVAPGSANAPTLPSSKLYVEI